MTQGICARVLPPGHAGQRGKSLKKPLEKAGPAANAPLEAGISRKWQSPPLRYFVAARCAQLQADWINIPVCNIVKFLEKIKF
ncbi:hypothetical protein [Polaromonas sp.]|uniref:hypothetical protein n=1 Tax=Polaromonas sp. TaxID=1869339 RepID=UPI003BB50EB7